MSEGPGCSLWRCSGFFFPPVVKDSRFLGLLIATQTHTPSDPEQGVISMISFDSLNLTCTM